MKWRYCHNCDRKISGPTCPECREVTPTNTLAQALRAPVRLPVARSGKEAGMKPLDIWASVKRADIPTAASAQFFSTELPDLGGPRFYFYVLLDSTAREVSGREGPFSTFQLALEHARGRKEPI